LHFVKNVFYLKLVICN